MRRLCIAATISVFVVMTALFAGGVPKDPTVAYVKFWADFEFGEVTTITYQDGSYDEFKGGHFVSSEIPISQALTIFQVTYEDLLVKMTSGDMKAAQANFNMGKWTDRMTAELYKGISDQQEIDAERIDAANDGTEDAAKRVAELTRSTAYSMQELKGSLNSRLATVSQNNSALISQMAAEQKEKNDQLDAAIKELKQNKGADPSVVTELQTDVEALATKIATLEEAKKKLEDANEEMKKNIDQINEKILTLGTHTNEMLRLSRWLGYDGDENPGIFMRPETMDGGTYAESANVLNYLSDFGVISYWSITNQALGIPPMANFFSEQLDENGKTNVLASFGAPKSWAGSGLSCTGGVYSVTENVTWVTNMVEHTNFVYNVLEHTNVVEKLFRYEHSFTNFLQDTETIVYWTNTVAYINRYLGGSTPTKQNPTRDDFIKPEDDPYSPEYNPSPIDDFILPVQNARMIVAITNAPWSKINAFKALDEFSVWTNGEGLVEIAGFSEDGVAEQYFSDGDFFPVRRILETTEGDFPVITWCSFPWGVTNSVDITTNEIEKVREWLKRIEEKNIFNIVVTNYEKFAQMKTNLWSQVDVDKLLDGKSVWTNGERKVEIKGFDKAENGMTPIVKIDDGGNRSVEWKDAVPKVDSDETYDIVGSEVVKMSTIDISDEFMIPTNNVLTLHGFLYANENDVPYKKKVGGSANSYEIGWKRMSGSALKFVGTDGSNKIIGAPSYVTNTVEFATAGDSDVRVTVGTAQDGNVKITFGVYYK